MLTFYEHKTVSKLLILKTLKSGRFWKFTFQCKTHVNEEAIWYGLNHNNVKLFRISAAFYFNLLRPHFCTLECQKRIIRR